MFICFPNGRSAINKKTWNNCKTVISLSVILSVSIMVWAAEQALLSLRFLLVL